MFLAMAEDGRDQVELTDDDLLREVTFALRQRRSLLNQRIANWWDDTRPEIDRKSTRLNSSHVSESRMPSSA